MKRAERMQARKERERIVRQQAMIYDTTCGLCEKNEQSQNTLSMCEGCPFLTQNALIGEQLLALSKRSKARARKEAEQRVRKRQLYPSDYLLLRGVYDDRAIAKMAKVKWQQFLDWQHNNKLRGV